MKPDEDCLLSLPCPILPPDKPLFIAMEITPAHYNFYKRQDPEGLLYLRHDVAGAIKIAVGKDAALAWLARLYADHPLPPSTGEAQSPSRAEGSPAILPPANQE